MMVGVCGYLTTRVPLPLYTSTRFWPESNFICAPNQLKSAKPPNGKTKLPSKKILLICKFLNETLHLPLRRIVGHSIFFHLHGGDVFLAHTVCDCKRRTFYLVHKSIIVDCSDWINNIRWTWIIAHSRQRTAFVCGLVWYSRGYLCYR